MQVFVHAQSCLCIHACISMFMHVSSCCCRHKYCNMVIQRPAAPNPTLTVVHSNELLCVSNITWCNILSYVQLSLFIIMRYIQPITDYIYVHILYMYMYIYCFIISMTDYSCLFAAVVFVTVVVIPSNEITSAYR